MCGLRAEVRPFLAAARPGEDEGEVARAAPQDSGSPGTDGSGAACGAAGGGPRPPMAGRERDRGADGGGLLLAQRHGGRAGPVPVAGPRFPLGLGALDCGRCCFSA